MYNLSSQFIIYNCTVLRKNHGWFCGVDIEYNTSKYFMKVRIGDHAYCCCLTFYLSMAR